MVNQLVDQGDLLAAVSHLSAAQWALGDLGLERLQNRTAEQARVEVALMAETTRLAEKTVRRYVQVSNAYPVPSRQPEVPWSIHRVFAAQSNRESLINRAARERWTYDQAVKAVRIPPPSKLPFDVAIESLEAAHDRVLVTLAALRLVDGLTELQHDLLQRSIERTALPLDWCRSFLTADGATWEEGLAQLLEDR